MRLLPFLLVACAPPGPSHLLQSPPPDPLTLDVSAMVRGADVVWEIEGAAPGAEVLLILSPNGIGPGPCPTALGGACLGIRAPVTVMGTFTADATGAVRVQRPIPAGVGLNWASFQAVAPAPVPAILSAPVTRPVLDAPALHRTVVYDEALAPGWAIETWPCYGAGAPAHDLADPTLVRFGALAATFDHDCDGGWSGVGFDRRAVDWSVVQDWFPNQVVAANFRFHTGAAVADDTALHLTVDRGTKRLLGPYLTPADAAGWREASVPLVDLHGGQPFHALMVFSDSPTLRPRYHLDRVELLWRDDVADPVISSLVARDVTPAEATIAFTTDELTRADLRIRVNTATFQRSLPWSTSRELPLEGLPADTLVRVEVTVHDHQEQGPQRRATSTLSFRTQPADVTPPVLSNLSVTRQGATVATVCWTTDEPADAVVTYAGQEVSDPRLSTEHCLDVPDLPPASTTPWTAASTDRWGNTGTAAGPAPIVTAAVPSVQVTIEANAEAVPFPAQMRGVNLVNWAIMWGRPYPDQAPKLRELTRLIAPGILRHAGGNWSNQVRWDPEDTQCAPGSVLGCGRVPFSFPEPGVDTCGPTPRTVWRAYTHAYQADELDAVAAFADEVGAELMIEVNGRTCDPEQWADMVAWANLDRGYGVRWWEIGNEFDLLSVLGDTQVPVGADYADTFLAYHQAMTAVDPSIQLIGPAASQHVEEPSFHTVSNHVEPFLDVPAIQAPGVLGALSYHHYSRWNGLDPVTAEELLDFGPAYDPAARAWLDRGPGDWRALLQARGMEGPLVAVTELGPVVVAQPTVLNTNHVGALYFLDALPRLAWAGADLIVAWDLYDDVEGAHYGLIDQGPSTWMPDGLGGSVLHDAYAPRPAWYAYLMLAQWFGDTLVDVAQPVPELTVWASEDADGGLYLLVVHTGDDTKQLGLQVNGGNVTAAETWVLANEDFVRAADAESVPEGTTLNGLQIDTSTALSIEDSFEEIVTSAVVVPAPGGALQLTVGPYQGIAVRLVGP
jgi:hypothetical protein